MRHHLVRAAVLASLLFGAGLAFAFSTGPPASRTGAFPAGGKSAEPACNVCHGSGTGIALNDPSGLLEILDVPDYFTPGQVYPLRLRLSHTWNPLPETPLRWGFEIQAVDATTGDSSGVWVLGLNAPPDAFQVRPGLSTTVWRNRRYLEHTAAAIREGSPGPVEWIVRWEAPWQGEKVYFFAAGNSANGDGASIGSTDYIFTAVDSTRIVPPVSTTTRSWGRLKSLYR